VLLELAERDSDARQRLNRINQVADERLRDLLALGKQRGVIRAEIDPLAASVLVRRSIEAAATEVFVHRMTGPRPRADARGTHRHDLPLHLPRGASLMATQPSAPRPDWQVLSRGIRRSIPRSRTR
jgi:hypothetical protein